MNRPDESQDGYSDEVDPIDGTRKLVAPYLSTILQAENEEDAIRKLHEILGPALTHGGFSRVPALLDTLVQYIRAEYAGKVPEEGHVHRVPVDDDEEDDDEEERDSGYGGYSSGSWD